MLIRAALILMCLSLAGAAQTPATKATPTKAAPKKAATKAAPAKTPPTAMIHTTEGDLKCTLFADQEPKAVANFIGLAKGTKTWKNPVNGENMHGKPLYDGVIFHRVIPDFMIQTGDPSGTGSGDVGFEIKDNLDPSLLFDQPGRLAMANRGGDPGTSASQFFITEKAVPSLNPKPDGTGYILFGQCDDAAVELVKKIARMPCQGNVGCTGINSRPLNPVKIKHIDIVGAGAASKAPAKKAATSQKSTTPATPKK